MFAYDYDTCKITRDFVFLNRHGYCKKENGRPRGIFCRGCENYLGEKGDGGKFILCTYEKKDDPGFEEIYADMCHRLREEAITHYYD